MGIPHKGISSFQLIGLGVGAVVTVFLCFRFLVSDLSQSGRPPEVQTIQLLSNAVVVNPATLTPSSALAPPLVETASPTASCVKEFKYSYAVFTDDGCFPPAKVYTLNAFEVLSIRSSIKASRLDPIKTQNWQVSINPSRVENSFQFEPAKLKTLANAVLHRWDSTTFVEGDRYWLACERCLDRALHPHSTNRPPSRTIEEAVLMSSQIWGFGFYHYMSEKAFMLGAARSILESNPNSVLIIEEGPGPYMSFLKDILGISLDRVYVLSSQNDVWLVKKMHMTFYMSCGYVSPMNQRLIRKWVRDRHPAIYPGHVFTVDDPRQNVYVQKGSIVILDRSEGGGCNRCIRNTGDLVTMLQGAVSDHPIVHLRAGDISVTGQMEIFAKCELLIAPHGAGLTNMLYMPDNGKILEIQNHPGYFHLGYYDMAHGFGLKYRGIGPLQTDPTRNIVDFNRMDVQKTFEAAMELLLA